MYWDDIVVKTLEKFCVLRRICFVWFYVRKKWHIFIQLCVLFQRTDQFITWGAEFCYTLAVINTDVSQWWRTESCLCQREIVSLSSVSVEGRAAAVRPLHCHLDAAIHLLHLTNGATAECREQRLPQIEFVLSPQESSSWSISPLCTTAMSPSPSPLCCPRWQPSAGKNIRPAASFHTWGPCPTAAWLWPPWTAPTSSASPKGLLLMMVRLWRNNSQLRGCGSREFHLELRTRSKSTLLESLQSTCFHQPSLSLLPQTSTTPGWPPPSSQTSWSSFGFTAAAFCPPTAPATGRSWTSPSSKWGSSPSNAARTTPSGPSAPPRPGPLGAGEAGCAWATSTATRRRRSAAAGRCVCRTRSCGRPTGRLRWSGRSVEEERPTVDQGHNGLKV